MDQPRVGVRVGPLEPHHRVSRASSSLLEHPVVTRCQVSAGEEDEQPSVVANARGEADVVAARAAARVSGNEVVDAGVGGRGSHPLAGRIIWWWFAISSRSLRRGWSHWSHQNN